MTLSINWSRRHFCKQRNLMADTKVHSWHAGHMIVAGMIYKVSLRLKLLARAEAARYFKLSQLR
ncbi:MAG: hypothetical protein NTY08_00300 [Proteobacteria bacterium]|nr:hypothetical protein [Pseudomonadota bacterium]